MSENNWDRIQEVFFAAADLPPDQRASFLAGACNGDAALRSEVESLLKADHRSDSAIAGIVGSEVKALLDNDAPLAGTRMGPYRLIKEIGRGGMGSVYLGERDDEQYRKLVAIKVVKRGMDSTEVLARFRHERQILAGLEHPYIARLIDGGNTPDGRPFFVMEYVQGQPIDAYCRAQSLNVERRLRLFLRVCEAVAYAHRSLVVHRDLKPSNIFVTAEEIPKLLDFGVAKLLDPGNDPGLTATALGMGPLTPEYASPEQIRGLPITTAADVYALGAILFELLTGTRAQRIDTHTPAEIERVVCQAETPRPSTVGRAPGTPRIDSDLDNIVLMAMRKEPVRRYGSVNQLADDVLRYLERRPVLARQDSVVYRTRKFVVRNRLALAAAFLVFLSLVGGIVLAEVQAHRAEQARRFAETQRQSAEHERYLADAQRQVAERERARAEAEAQVARTEQERSRRRLAEMLQLANRSLFDVHSAIEKLPGATEARRQIVTTTLQFLENLSKDAGQDDELRFMLAASYFKVANVLGYPIQPNLGDTKGALENYEKSIAFLAPLLAKNPNHPDYALQEVQTKVNWATLLSYSGERPRAVEMLRGSLPVAQRLPRLCPAETQCLIADSAVYSELINILMTTNLAEAPHYSQLQTDSLEKEMKAFPGNPDIQAELGTAYSQQAKVFNSQGRLPEAVERYRRAAALKESLLARTPTDVLVRRSLMITYGNLGGNLGSPMYLNLGDAAGAREYYGKALAIARDLAKIDPDNQLAQYDLANALLFYSSLDLPREEWPESLADLQLAERILQKLVAADPRSISKLRVLALDEQYEALRLEDLGKLAEARVLIRETMAKYEEAIGRTNNDVGLLVQLIRCEDVLADILAEQGDQSGAVEMARQAIARAERVSNLHAEPYIAIRAVASSNQHLATVEAAFGNWNDARIAAQRSLEAWQEVMASGSWRADPVRVAAVEALLKDCDAHLH